MRHLLAAAQRGVKAEVLLDGYGSPDLSDEFVNELTAAGVVFLLLRSPPSPFWYAHQCVSPDASQNCGDRRAYRLYWRAELLRRAYVQLRSRRLNRITRYALKGRLSKIFSSLSWKTCWTERGTTLVATSSQSGREPPAGRSAGIAGLAR